MQRFLFLLFLVISNILVWSSLLLAQTNGQPLTANQQPSFAQMLIQMLPMFLLVYFIFYFMVSRPQQIKQRQQQQLLDELTNGEMVVTSGGIIAKVADKKKEIIVLDSGSGAKFKVLPSHIVRKYAKSEGSK